MPASRGAGFIDTNVLVYLSSADAAKADAAERIVQAGGPISVQVLTELSNVARRKMGLSWPELHDMLASLRGLLAVVPLMLQVHAHGLALAECHLLSIHDAMIIAAARQAARATPTGRLGKRARPLFEFRRQANG